MALKLLNQPALQCVKPFAGHEVEKGGIVALEPKEATGKITNMTATTSAGVEDVI